MDLLAAPYHFIATFLVTVAALGAASVTIYRPQFVPPGNWRRVTFGVGWILLALGELLHGSQMASSDQDPIVIVLRVSAYVLVVAALQPLVLAGTRDGPNEVSITSPESPDDVELEPLASQKPEVASPEVPEDMEELSSEAPPAEPRRVARGVPVPAVRRLVLALALFALSEAFFLSVDSLKSSNSGSLWLTVHGLRFAGGLAVLAWLGQVVRTSIQARVVAVFIAVLLVIVVAISGSMTQVFTANITQDSFREARREGVAQYRRLQEQVQDSISRAQQVARLDEVIDAFAARSPTLSEQVSKLQTPGGPFESSDFIAFLDPRRAISALSASGRDGRTTLDVPEVLSLPETNAVTMALRGRPWGSLERLGPRTIAAIGAYPAQTASGLAGMVVVGRLIDEEYLTELRRPGGEEAFLITRTEILAKTTDRTDGVLRSDLDPAFESGSRVVKHGVIGGVDYFSSYVPLRRESDDRVIAVLVFSKRSQVVGLAQRNVATPLFLIALWAMIVGVALSLLFGSRITQPIRKLTEAAERVRRGDLTPRVSPRTADEVGVLGETFDQMTESLYQATQNLRENAELEFQLRRQLETILQSMTDGVVAVDHAGTIVAFNREAERILEVRQSEALGKSIRTVLRLRDAEGKEIDPSIYELRQGSVSGVVGDLPNASRPVVVTSAPIEDEAGTIIGGVAVVRDQTREVEIEKMKTEFLANISHELRTPITPIKGYSDLMRRREVPREQAITFLEGIMASAERLERIVEMLVDFSAMEAGRLSPKKVPVDFDEITADLVEKWMQSAPNHRFERRGFETLPRVNVDRRLVPLAISELMDNAVKFSPNGGLVLLEGECRNGGRETGDVRISVIDEGIGIGKEQLSRIGQNFVQADASETRAYGGLGLGLAYVRRIVEGHGGRLEVQSTPDEGSCFTIVLPASTVIPNA
jgi:PAS domain S-box-containing protein